MTVQTIVMVPPKYVEDAQTVQYTVIVSQSSTVVDIIDAITVTNVGSVASEFSCNLVPSGGAAAVSNLIINTRRIEPGETYLCPELVGQALNEGDFVSTLASVANTLVIRVSGREITT